MELSENNFSYVAEVKINAITQTEAGKYTCLGYGADGSEKYDTITITVEGKILWYYELKYTYYTPWYCLRASVLY